VNRLQIPREHITNHPGNVAVEVQTQKQNRLTLATRVFLSRSAGPSTFTMTGGLCGIERVDNNTFTCYALTRDYIALHKAH
jgi:hypothetical protein